jgi:hypothetical protein
MLEITGLDVAALNDEDSRGLVGRLCEAEVRAAGLPTSSVTWGGNQNAPDGGIDVRVALDGEVQAVDFLPMTNVGFQVKKTDFTPGLIAPEMRPSGRLRPSITDIASSGSDASDSALQDRLSAMTSAIADTDINRDLFLDFYDRNRLATWTMNHPSLVIWARQKVGRSVAGWQPYESWAPSPDGLQDEYLLDEKARLYRGISDERGATIQEGLDTIRNLLRMPRGVVRLAGLSGVGKTRLVQALFDDRVGKEGLPPAIAIYTDMNDNPAPQPSGMLSDLIAARYRAIIVVDNCPPDLHRRMTELCRNAGSELSLISIEYDVQDDEPEGTEVFRLETSSNEVISKLVARRFPAMTQLDVNKIAEFSGGNARIALALSNTLERHETVAGLRDEELFKRLFHQRQEHDGSLLRAAQACALVYSFQGEALNGDDAELPKIGSLVGMSAQQLFAKVAQLRQRDLVQRRSVWRAVLPHAIANRLAKMALHEIPYELIEQQFTTARLLKSFSRRLSYLHECEEAKTIGARWLGPEGLLADVGRLNELGQTMFENVAPVSPELTLWAIERGLADGDFPSSTSLKSWRDKLCSLLRSIAYDEELFDRSVAGLITLALSEPQKGRSNYAEDALSGLFHVFLSGTHAKVEQRARIIQRLLESGDARSRLLGEKLLGALLQTDHFSAGHSFEFGARVRDYGYWPANLEDRVHWFKVALALAKKFVHLKNEIGAAVRSKIAHAVGDLWFLGPAIQEEVEELAHHLSTAEYWQEGWIAIRSFLSRPHGKADPAALERLRALERSMRPVTLVQQIQAVVLSERWGAFDFAETDENDETDAQTSSVRHEKVNRLAEDLGQQVALDDEALSAVLPQLVRGKPGRVTPFGMGLAKATSERRHIWERLTEALAQTEEKSRNTGALAGLLMGINRDDPSLCDELLEEALNHEALGTWFLALQTSVPISEAGADRLKRAVALGKASINSFQFLGWGRSSDLLTGKDLSEIILAIADQKDGFAVAMDVLSMRFQYDGDQNRTYPPELVDAGKHLLAGASFDDHNNMGDYHLRAIANVCLLGPPGESAARSLCDRIRKGLSDYSFTAYGHEQLLQILFKLQPRVALDVLFDKQSAEGALNVDDFDDPSDRRKNPLDEVPQAEILSWCDERPTERYATLSRAVSFHSNEGSGITWTPLAREMLKRAPDSLAVLKHFVGRFSPTSWMGSRAAIVEARLPLLEQLDGIVGESISEFIREARTELVEDITRSRKWETERDSDRDERFEN